MSSYERMNYAWIHALQLAKGQTSCHAVLSVMTCKRQGSAVYNVALRHSQGPTGRTACRVCVHVVYARVP